MSDTQRTDERIVIHENCEWVSANFARGLEREIAQSNRIIEAQYRGVINSERILSEALGVNDGSEILDAIQALKERVKRLEEALDTLTLVVGLTPVAGNKQALQEAMDIARAALKAKEAA